MHTKQFIPIVPILAWIIIIFSYPLIGNTIKSGELAWSFYLILASFSLGTLITDRIRGFAETDSFTYTGISIFLGWLTLSLLLLLDLPLLIYIITFSILFFYRIYIYMRLKIGFSFTFDPSAVWIAIVAFAASIPFVTGYTYLLTVERLPVYVANFSGPSFFDPLYFVTVVASLKNGTIYSAIYDQGAALNYQILGFLPPAFLARVSGTTSQVALYGLWFPILKVLPFALISQLVRHWLNTKILFYLLLSIAFFVLFQPLHPIYILKWKPDLFVWGGLGYLGVSSNIGFDVSIVLSLLVLLLLYSKDSESNFTLYESLFFILLFSLLIGIKIPMFFATGCLLGSISLVRWIRDGTYKLFFLLIVSLIPTVIIMYFIYLGEESPAQLSFKYGFIADYFSEHIKLPLNSISSHIKVLAFMLILFILWAGIRSIGILILIFTTKDRNKFLWEFSLGAILTLIFCTAFASFYSVKIVDHHGKFLLDGSFDALQFPRAAFYFVSLAGVTGIVYCFIKIKNKYVLGSIALLSAAWCLITLVNFIVTNKTSPYPRSEPWIQEVRETLQKAGPGLLAVNPKKTYYTVPLAASDAGNFWIAFGRDHAGYNSSLKNGYRQDVFSDLVSGSPDKQRAALQRMKSEKVELLIFTPGEEQCAASLLNRNMIAPIPGSNWVYRVK